ncbi:P1 family peptidase [Sulfitobacter sp. S0837]|uniref:P1 family peptidase n=1 Tax=Sulfitobacter maritimus TaxID=2741719 RepID=UPI00158268EE|nr:P1 family peptidase [Sulfitobacter maritimus]NUH66440.1 P1 family peptidase [Sulfitobacter maritimus]
MRHTLDCTKWWSLPPGAENTICDVPGVQVGNADLRGPGLCSGVTAILPHGGDMFRQPVPAGLAVLNGFGKSIGLVQLAELGEIETPILLTNTFGVGPCGTALIRRAIAANPDIGRSLCTVNPLALECNDGTVNDIQALAVSEDHALAALDARGTRFAQGTVGAGSGMKTFGYAGGLGSSSRRVTLGGGAVFTLGALVLSNFGQQSALRVLGRQLPPPQDDGTENPDRGSIIIILATDAPMESRQLTRMARRSSAALGRLGSHIGHQSGDIALAFSTAQVRHRDGDDVHITQGLNERCMDAFFVATVEAVEEAVLNALWHAVPHKGYDGTTLPSFRKQATAAFGLSRDAG